MKLVNRTDAHLTVQLERSEVDFLCNAINETLEALDQWEFPVRTGIDRADAQALLSELKELRNR